MPLSGSSQNQVQWMIDAASVEERQELREKAEATLAEINSRMGKLLLSKEESKASEIAIEILMRLEATEKNRGWWFRTKRRIQITQMYLGS